jgi:hypothetical protein
LAALALSGCWDLGALDARTCAAVLCEDFESQTIDASKWSIIGDPVVVDTAMAHSGVASAHAHATAVAGGASGGSQIGTDVLMQPALAAALHVRAWMYLPSSDAFAHPARLMAAQQGGSGSSLFLNLSDQIMVSDTASGAHTSGTAPPRDRWFCVEWATDFSSANGDSTVSIDGTPAASITGTMALFSPPASRIVLGVYTYQPAAAQAALDVWLDDLIIDNKPIGCTQ